MPVPAVAGQMDVFGIELRKPLNLPMCAGDYVGSKFISGRNEQTCYLPDPNHLGGTAGYTVELHKTFPTYLANNKILVEVLDGKVVGVYLNTSGIKTQNVLMKVLKDKIGEPTAHHARSVLNRQGVAISTFTSTWNLNNIYVEFDPVKASLEEGIVWIATQEERMRKEEVKRRKAAAVPKL